MAKFMLFVAIIVVVDAAHRHHPKFRQDNDEDIQNDAIVPCSSGHDLDRNDLILKARCGTPKEVFVKLDPTLTSQQVTPSAVWVKRCVGLCDHEAEGSTCMALETTTKQIPVRVYNAETNKESCATFALEEHVKCGCCRGSPADCSGSRVFIPPEPEYEVESI